MGGEGRQTIWRLALQIELYFLQSAADLLRPLNVRNEAAAVSLLLQRLPATGSGAHLRYKLQGNSVGTLFASRRGSLVPVRLALGDGTQCVASQEAHTCLCREPLAAGCARWGGRVPHQRVGTE